MSTHLDLAAALGGWHEGLTLPQAFYVDEDVFAADLEDVYGSQWLFAGHTVDVRSPGDYFTATVGRDSVIIVRDDDGTLRAHHNVCRHRGSRLLPEGTGHVRGIVCPYHQWSYGLDGGLKRVRSMGESFCPESWSLKAAHVEEMAGLVFVCFAEEAPSFAAARAAIEPQLAPHGWATAAVAARHRYVVAANWKLLVENNRECYHCRGGHPEFCATNYDLGVDGDDRADEAYEEVTEEGRLRWEEAGLDPRVVSFPDGQFFRVARLPLKPGCVTESLDGRQVAPTMGMLPHADVGSLRMIGLPNLWAHANVDYGMTTRLIPTGPTTTEVEVTFLVAPDAVVDVDYRVEDVEVVWRATSEQDWALCENNQAGVSSRAYEPGPYSPSMEASVASFTGWYLQLLRAAGRHLAVVG
ncbi:aromatic ring-hydroxylating dioxygenase subunit alpha [soil metagenome]